MLVSVLNHEPKSQNQQRGAAGSSAAQRFSAQPRAEEPKPRSFARAPEPESGFSAQPRAEEPKPVPEVRNIPTHVDVSVLNHEPKSQNLESRARAKGGLPVSVLNHEPKSQNLDRDLAHTRDRIVSVLNHEPKSQNLVNSISASICGFVSVLNHEPKSQNLSHDERHHHQHASFSAQPRAEEPKPHDVLLRFFNQTRFSAQPRAEEPKLIQSTQAFVGWDSFSAQPRAEEPKLLCVSEVARAKAKFQCSTTSRRAKTQLGGQKPPEEHDVSVLNHEPKSQNPFRRRRQHQRHPRFSAQPRAEEPKPRILQLQQNECESFSAQPRAEEPKLAIRASSNAIAAVSVLNHEPKSQNPRTKESYT